MTDAQSPQDAPTPPGGPQRGDAPDGSVTPGEAGPTGSEPPAHPGTPGESSSPMPEPTATGEVHATTQADQVNEELQGENAETSLDQPSDGSGGE